MGRNRQFEGYSHNQEPQYYNIVATDNPYIFDFVSVKNIEDLSDQFVILNPQTDQNSKYIQVTGKTYGQSYVRVMADLDLLKATINTYKNSLIENKKAVISDPAFSDQLIKNIVANLLKTNGLSLSKQGNIYLSRAKKIVSKDKETKPNKLSEGTINYYFEAALMSYIKDTFGIYIKLKLSQKNRYTALLAFKRMLPDVTYTNMCKYQYAGYVRNEYDVKCEELWNNPELAKLEPKKGKKNG